MRLENADTSLSLLHTDKINLNIKIKINNFHVSYNNIFTRSIHFFYKLLPQHSCSKKKISPLYKKERNIAVRSTLFIRRSRIINLQCNYQQPPSSSLPIPPQRAEQLTFPYLGSITLSYVDS